MSSTSLTEVEQVPLEEIALAIKSRKLEAPAVFLLELCKPLITLLYTGSLVTEPILNLLAGSKRIEQLKLILNDREKVEQLIRLLEESKA